MKNIFLVLRVFLVVTIVFGLSNVVVSDVVNESESSSAFIDLTVSGTHIEIGDTILVEGYILPSLLARPGDKVLLQVTSPKESRADVFNQLKVHSDGIFSLELPADAIGDWSFIARYGDYSSDAVPLKVVGRAKVKETELTASGPFSLLNAGNTARFSGWLRDVDGNGIPLRQVWYSFGLPSYSCALCEDDGRRIWQTLGPATTDEVGYFEFGFEVREKGTYAIKASFPGDEIYAAAESAVLYPQVL